MQLKDMTSSDLADRLLDEDAAPDQDVIDEAAARLRSQARAVAKWKSAAKEAEKRIELLEDLIINSRGDLAVVDEYRKRTIVPLTKLLPMALEHAQQITRGKVGPKNYENQFRHAEYRAKVVKEHLRDAKKLMGKMILSVSSVADRTHNQVNPEDLEWLQAELDHFCGFFDVTKSIADDPFFDGKLPDLNLMEGTGRAHELPAIAARKKVKANG